MKKYPQSILQEDLTKCCICGKRAEVHHVMNGSLRDKSTKYGLVIGLCPEHHRGTHGVHNDPKLAQYFKAKAQEAFEERYDHDLWFKEFHKNYI